MNLSSISSYLRPPLRSHLARTKKDIVPPWMCRTPKNSAPSLITTIQNQTRAIGPRLLIPTLINQSRGFFSASKPVEEPSPAQARVDPVSPAAVAAPTGFTVPVIDLATREQTGTVDLNPFIFGTAVRNDLLHRTVTWQRAKLRAGTANSKGRGEKSGSTRKIQPQKGTGRARASTVRAPGRRKSGKAHGPHPRDWSFSLNKKVRRIALRCALSSKFSQGTLMICSSFDLPSHKTKELLQTANHFNWNRGQALVIDGSRTKNKNFDLASRNMGFIDFEMQSGFSVYEILRHKYLVLNLEALSYLNSVIKGQ